MKLAHRTVLPARQVHNAQHATQIIRSIMEAVSVNAQVAHLMITEPALVSPSHTSLLRQLQRLLLGLQLHRLCHQL